MNCASNPLKPLLVLITLIALSAPVLLSHMVSANRMDDPPAPAEGQAKQIKAVDDAIAAANRAIKTADELRRDAVGKAERITSLSAFGEASDVALRNLEDLSKLVKEINDGHLFESLDKSVAKDETAGLPHQTEEIKKAQTALSGDSKPPAADKPPAESKPKNSNASAGSKPKNGNANAAGARGAANKNQGNKNASAKSKKAPEGDQTSPTEAEPAAEDEPAAADEPPAAIKEAQSRAEAAIKRIDAQVKSTGDAKDQLRKALTAVPNQVNKLVGTLSPRVQELNKVAEEAAAKDVLKALSKDLTNLASVERLQRAINNRWKSLKEELAKALRGNTELPETVSKSLNDVDESLKKVADTTTPVIKRLPKWTEKLTAHMLKTKGELDDFSNAVIADPQNPNGDIIARGNEGRDKQQQAETLVAELNRLHAALAEFAIQLQETALAGFDAKDFLNTVSELQKATANLQTAAAVLDEKLTGDFSQFVEDQVSLYYFTDVPRLMRILNSTTHEVGGIRGAREQAAEQRLQLANAELSLADAQAEVATHQRRLAEMQEELRQSRAGLDLQETLLRKTSLRLKHAQDDKGKTKAEFDKAKSAHDADEADPEKKAAFEQAQSKLDKANVDEAEAARKNQETERERDAASQQQTALNDEKKGLPAKIADAQDKLHNAQSAVASQRRAAFLKAQSEVEAFALARDNTPYWFAPAVASSTDPAKRVLMYAFDDSKTLFLRGNKSDVERVKEIIAGFDRPSPQARLTLWTLEISGQGKGKDKDAQSVNAAISMIDKDLAQSRAKIAASLSFLRDCVHKTANRVASERLQKTSPIIYQRVHDAEANEQDLKEWRKSSFTFYQPEVLHKLGYDPNPVPSRARVVATAETEVDNSYLIPDPTATTTLGETLVVLSLARPAYGKMILDEFSSKLATVLASLDPEQPPASTPAGNAAPPAIPWFANTRRVLGLDGNGVPTDSLKLTAAQLEIINAIDRYNRYKLTEHLQQLIEEWNNLEREGQGNDASQRKAQIEIELLNSEVGKLNARLSEMTRQQQPAPGAQSRTSRRSPRGRNAKPASPPDSQSPAAQSPPQPPDEHSLLVQRMEKQNQINQKEVGNKNRARQKQLIEAKQRNLQKEVLSLANFIYQREGRSLSVSSVSDTAKFDETSALVNELSKHNPLREANARVAAADQMLKEFIIAVEDDLDRHFVQPMIDSLRDKIKKRGVNVGVIQRTSVLATNRLIARVDPRGSAQLAIGEEQNILQSVQQLAQLYFAAQTAGVLGVFKALDAQPRGPEPEIYGITTGNTFQVTPIFDPSGQALRFKFDHVAATQIREPDGTLNPQLPRIERHTVNTEVQISNLELREVSRFEANAQVGIPTRYWGGLPILKDIPKVRSVPLIGWFVRKAGSAALSQQSLIFAQTTMYPTIGDITGLLTNPLRMKPVGEQTPKDRVARKDN